MARARMVAGWRLVEDAMDSMRRYTARTGRFKIQLAIASSG